MTSWTIATRWFERVFFDECVSHGFWINFNLVAPAANAYNAMLIAAAFPPCFFPHSCERCFGHGSVTCVKCEGGGLIRKWPKGSRQAMIEDITRPEASCWLPVFIAGSLAFLLLASSHAASRAFE